MGIIRLNRGPKQTLEAGRSKGIKSSKFVRSKSLSQRSPSTTSKKASAPQFPHKKPPSLLEKPYTFLLAHLIQRKDFFISYLKTPTANMKSYATPIALSAVAFITMLQPCPAPVVSTLAIAGTGAAIFGAGTGLGLWGASKVIGATKAPAAIEDPGLAYRQDLTPFEHCTYDGLGTAQSIEFPANGSIIVAALPQSCMDWFAHYNQHPAIDALNEVHGTIVTINASAVELANLPPYVMTYVEASLLNGTQEKTVSRARRAIVAAEAFTV